MSAACSVELQHAVGHARPGARCSARRPSNVAQRRRHRSRRRTRGCRGRGPRWPSGSCGREPLVVVVVAVDDDVGAGRVERPSQNGASARVVRRARPELKSGWCQIASVHVRRSTRRGPRRASVPWAESGAAAAGLAAHRSRASTTCHAPRSYEYHGSPSGAAAAAPEVIEVALEVLGHASRGCPESGRVRSLTRPQTGS